MANEIISESFLTEEQRRNLPLLLNMIIPPHKGKGMPGAGELDFIGYLSKFASDQIEAIQKELNMLEQESQVQYKEVVSGDLSLLDPVRKRKQMYRDV